MAMTFGGELAVGAFLFWAARFVMASPVAEMTVWAVFFSLVAVAVLYCLWILWPDLRPSFQRVARIFWRCAEKVGVDGLFRKHLNGVIEAIASLGERWQRKRARKKFYSLDEAAKVLNVKRSDVENHLEESDKDETRGCLVCSPQGPFINGVALLKLKALIRNTSVGATK